jgi:glutathione S-transferase
MTLTLYIGNKNYSSWSLRPWILLTELGIPFQEKVVPIQDSLTNWDKFRTFSPNGKVPCLVDEDKDITVWDSLAIMEYVAEEHPKVWPSTADENHNKAARAWGRCAAAEMHSGFAVLRTICSMNVGIHVKLHDDVYQPEESSSPLAKDVARIDELWAEGLTRFGGPFLTGPTFTAVDACFAPVVFRIQTYGLQLSNPMSRDYCQRLLDLPSMQAWSKAGVKETWRIEIYEADVRSYGTITEDRRAT